VIAVEQVTVELYVFVVGDTVAPDALHPDVWNTCLQQLQAVSKLSLSHFRIVNCCLWKPGKGEIGDAGCHHEINPLRKGLKG
jgi:hypothetical protein